VIVVNIYTNARFWSQGVLTAVLSAVMGSKDPDQVSTMAKQAGEVPTLFLYTYLSSFFLLKFQFQIYIQKSPALSLQKPVQSESILNRDLWFL
jgi:hypothetical protein